MTQDVEDAMEGVQQLVADALIVLERGGEPHDVLDLFRERVPDGDAAWWCLAARIVMNRTIGVVEAWLDSPTLDDPIGDILRANLAVVVAEGIGAELTPEGLVELAEEASRGRGTWRDIVAPLLFVTETLTMVHDPDTEALILLG